MRISSKLYLSDCWLCSAESIQGLFKVHKTEPKTSRDQKLYKETKPYIDKSIKQRWNKTLEIEGIIGRYNE